MNSSRLDPALVSPEQLSITSLPNIEVEGLQKNYGKLAAIRGIDFIVPRGKSLA
jgi:hypothetical protein